MGFLSDLADQFSLGENTLRTLDATIDDKFTRYGELGEFASKFDQSAQRRYLEEGYIRQGATNIDSKQFEVLMQQPSATVMIKKRMFSSMGESYRLDYMDADEKIYYKAMSHLFHNKCKQIAALEKLSKIQKIASALDNVDDQLMSIVFSLTDELASTSGSDAAQESDNLSSGGKEVSSFLQTMDRIRKLQAFNKSARYTSWISDESNLFKNQYGAGTGVIEITNFTSFNVSSTNNISNPGRFSISIADPYESMVITEFDIEKAIADATNGFNNSSAFFAFSENANDLIVQLTTRLNTRRDARGASRISFKMNPDTILGRRLTAIIEGLGLDIQFEFDYFKTLSLNPDNNGVDVQKEYLINGELAGFQGLDDEKKLITIYKESELSLFGQLVAAYYNKMAMDKNSKNALQLTNKKTNYARRKLRFNFLGKNIIQPMDNIHFYINSQSKFDTRVLAGLKDMFTGVNVMQAFSKNLAALEQSFDLLFNPQSLSVAAERSVYVGEDFSPFLWAMVRSQFVNENEGVHVFAGVVENSKSSYNGGSFKVDVSGSDNSYYLTLGKVPDKPGADAWTGAIYDPLTPFKTRFDKISSNYKDEVPTLLDENQIILGEKLQNEGSLLKFKSGPYAGKPVTGKNYIQDRTVDPVTKQFTRTFYAPDGLAYRWKEGIGVFVQYGSAFYANDPQRAGAQRITADAFAGQDVMNTISLLITGHPYNFANYWKSVVNSGNYGVDPYSKKDAANAYNVLLSSGLQKRNSLWGNFVPFKNLVMDEETYSKALQSLTTINKNNALIEDNLKKIERLTSQALLENMNVLADTPLAADIAGNARVAYDRVSSVVQDLKEKTNALLEEISAQDTTYIVQSGNDVTFDFDEYLYSGNDKKKASAAAQRRKLRREVNALTRRMSYSVRANEDKNLFIVDDSYDKDYDIAAFNSSLTNLQMYNTGTLNVKSKVTAAADLLNLEVFCDPQGHIRVRPPQYNRMPSSIFYKMMELKKSLKIQVFPDFLNDLFDTQLDTLRTRIEIVEDYIRLDCAILGAKDDTEVLSIVNENGSTSGNAVPFALISSKEGLITDLESLKKQAIPDAKENESFLKVVEQAENTKDIFSSNQRFDFLLRKLQEADLRREGEQATNPYNIVNSLDFESNLYINSIIKRVETKSGQKVNNFKKEPIPPYEYQNDPRDIDIFKVTRDLSEKISERQKAIKLFYSALKNSQQFNSIDDDEGSVGLLSLFGTFGNSEIPEVYEHMLEDESYDDLGPGSGKRYIIKNSQIKSYDISENKPEYTYVEVQGVLDPYNTGLPDGLNGFPQGGNGMTSAAAVDYDLWRNYGWSEAHSVSVPFLTDPKSQCAPYATSLLSRARQNILRGTVTIVGNEYMQPGEVVFLECKNMLFYVTQVNHNFSFGSNFTTTLTLSYGHVAGEYIPTTLDVIGKSIYNNKDIASFQVNKGESSYNESSFGSLVFIKDQKSPKKGTAGQANSTILKNMVLAAAQRVYTNQSLGDNTKTTVELRIYYDSKVGEVDSDLSKFAEEAKRTLTTIEPEKGEPSTSEIKKPKKIILPEDAVQITPVDISNDQETRSPSQDAWSKTRDLVKIQPTKENIPLTPLEGVTPSEKVEPSVIKKERDKLRINLFSSIVDCWLKVEILPPSKPST